MAHRRQRGFVRRAVALALAYCLALNGLLLGLAAAAEGRPGGADPHALCLAGADAQAPVKPAPGHHEDQGCCILRCATSIFAPPSASAPSIAFAPPSAALAPPPGLDEAPPRPTPHLPPLGSRAPPRLA